MEGEEWVLATTFALLQTTSNSRRIVSADYDTATHALVWAERSTGGGPVDIKVAHLVLDGHPVPACEAKEANAGAGSGSKDSDGGGGGIGAVLIGPATVLRLAGASTVLFLGAAAAEPSPDDSEPCFGVWVVAGAATGADVHVHFYATAAAEALSVPLPAAMRPPGDPAHWHFRPTLAAGGHATLRIAATNGGGTPAAGKGSGCCVRCAGGYVAVLPPPPHTGSSTEAADCESSGASAPGSAASPAYLRTLLGPASDTPARQRHPRGHGPGPTNLSAAADAAAGGAGGGASSGVVAVVRRVCDDADTAATTDSIDEANEDEEEKEGAWLSSLHIVTLRPDPDPAFRLCAAQGTLNDANNVRGAAEPFQVLRIAALLRAAAPRPATAPTDGPHDNANSDGCAGEEGSGDDDGTGRARRELEWELRGILWRLRRAPRAAYEAIAALAPAGESEGSGTGDVLRALATDHSAAAGDSGRGGGGAGDGRGARGVWLDTALAVLQAMAAAPGPGPATRPLRGTLVRVLLLDGQVRERE